MIVWGPGRDIFHDWLVQHRFEVTGQDSEIWLQFGTETEAMIFVCHNCQLLVYQKTDCYNMFLRYSDTLHWSPAPPIADSIGSAPLFPV